MMTKTLYVARLTVCTSRSDTISPLLIYTCHPSLCSHPLFGLHQRLTSISECQWVPFFLHGGSQCHTSASSALPCLMPFSQTALLLQSVSWQQNVTEYWQEDSISTAIPSTSASDITEHHNKIGGVTFGAALVQCRSGQHAVFSQINLLCSTFFKAQKRRRRIDRSMIGEPTNFVHTAHVGSGDLFSGMNSVSSIQNQMQSKGGYGGGLSANVQMQLVDTKAG
uniref:CDC42 small effector 2 n=1 Tax=Meleagris gallopavo TaxID=9103 RepID=A0A803YMY0_MELGA